MTFDHRNAVLSPQSFHNLTCRVADQPLGTIGILARWKVGGLYVRRKREAGSLFYVTPFAPGAASVNKWLVSNGGGSQPQWPRDGRQLYYLAPDKRIMAVPVSTTEGRFQSGAPHALLQPDIIDDFRVRFAVTSDGQRKL
jgi:hypothetical protein